MKNAFLSLLFLVLPLVLAEVILRSYYHDITTSDRANGYFSTRWMKSITTNGLGFRSKKFIKKKSTGNYRVALIGDSFAFGQGIAEEQRFGDRLEKHFVALPMEVLNFSRPGTSIEDHVEILQSQALGLKPDHLILQLYSNDFIPKGAASKFRCRGAFIHPWLENIAIRHSVLALLFNRAVRVIKKDLGICPNIIKIYHHLLADEFSPLSLHFKEQLTRFITIAQAHKIPLVIVIFPNSGVFNKGDYPFAYLHQRIADVAKMYQIPVVDPTPIFLSYPHPRELWVNSLDSHGSALANEIVAKEIILSGIFEPR